MLAITLAAAAAAVGALHALAPDHWLPIAAVSRARGWSLARTARVTFLCGFGHVTVSALLGLIALAAGARVVTAFGEQIASVAGVLMIGFGVAYALWGLRRLAHHAHAHAADMPSRRSTWALFAIYSADACVALIPILFAAASLPFIAVIAVIVVYEIATIGTMVALAVASRAGAGFFHGKWIEHYGDAAAGGLIAVTGIAVALFGI
jgi:hypothetical protein